MVTLTRLVHLAGSRMSRWFGGYYVASVREPCS